MKRQAAFIDSRKLLKGALHCHTTRSDGRGTPEEVLRKHAEHGYDFVALTDHRYYNFANYGDAPLTIIPGMEMDGNLPGVGWPYVHCHHIVSIGPEKAQGNGFEQDQRFESLRLSKPEDTQALLDKLHAANNLTIYCHPEWSGTPVREYEMLEGNFAMELWNSGCAVEDGVDVDNGHDWDELLAQGKVIYGVATDDGHAMSQHCLGWVRVNAENNVSAILDALKNGAFYASCGPEIYDFYVENGVAHVKCSPAAEVQFRHLNVPYRMTKPAEGETAVTEAEIKVNMNTGYIRAVVTDAEGRRAWTNPIFLDADAEN